MQRELFDYATVIGAIGRIAGYKTEMGPLSNYERLRLYNRAVGTDWAFRLLDTVGAEVIAANRPSWLNFYRDDCYGLHLPLDPRAPETDKYLGADFGAMEYAFYAGMGFDGYGLALRTKRKINLDNMSVELGSVLFSDFDSENLKKLQATILGPQHYYDAYGKALQSLFSVFASVSSGSADVDEDLLLKAARASLLFMCGGHQGCSAHEDRIEAQQTRLETIAIANCVTAICNGGVKTTALGAIKQAA